MTALLSISPQTKRLSKINEIQISVVIIGAAIWVKIIYCQLNVVKIECVNPKPTQHGVDMCIFSHMYTFRNKNCKEKQQ